MLFTRLLYFYEWYCKLVICGNHVSITRHLYIAAYRQHNVVCDCRNMQILTLFSLSLLTVIIDDEDSVPGLGGEDRDRTPDVGIIEEVSQWLRGEGREELSW